MSADTNQPQCASEDVAAYLDGELDEQERAGFELHNLNCQLCVSELLRQRQLLCALDVAFNNDRDVVLPRNFARVVATHAESDMRGMRDGSETRQALGVSLLLAVAAFALLGAASGELVWGPAGTLAQSVQSVLNFVWDTTYQAVTGLAVIFRMLTRSFVFESRLLGFFILLLFLAALALLPRLIARYHRTGILE